MKDQYLYEMRLQEMTEVSAVIGISWLAAIPTFFLLMSPSEALYALAIFIGVSVAIVGSYLLLMKLAFRENGKSPSVFSDLIRGPQR